MVQQTSFLGMPLRTQRQRRLLVVFYYVLFVSFSLLGLWKSHGHIGFLIPQVLTFGGLLGGIKIGGPVKVYSEPKLPLGMDSGTLTLNLENRKSFGSDRFPLDERERVQRDFAHYLAYRIFCVSLGIACCAYWLTLNWSDAWLSAKGPVVAWIVLVYVLSLPQSVLLWTEMSEPAGELTLLPRT